MEFLCVSVIVGMSSPFVVDCISSIALELGMAPFELIATCEKELVDEKNKKNKIAVKQKFKCFILEPLPYLL